MSETQLRTFQNQTIVFRTAYNTTFFFFFAVMVEGWVGGGGGVGGGGFVFGVLFTYTLFILIT